MNLLNYIHRGQKFTQLLLIAACSGFSAISHAALFDCITEPGFCIGEGNSVIFKYTGTTSSIGLFGTVQVIGDNIVSLPRSFRAESVNGAGTDSVSDNGTVQVIAKPGYRIDGVTILERGDYLMSGSNNSVAVDIDGWSSVWDWNDIFGPFAQQNLTIAGDLTMFDSNLHNWTGSANFDLSGATWDGINHIGLSLQNNLYATTLAAGDIAWIEKKFVGVGLVTNPVVHAPVPAAAWLFGSGLLALAGLVRRTSKA